MLVDYLLKKATSQLDSGVVIHPSRCRRHPAKSLNDLDFAHDIALLEPSISQEQAQLIKTAEAAADLGLVICAPKTEYVTVNCNPQPALQVYEDPINHASDLDTLVPWWYLAQVTSKGESHLLDVRSGTTRTTFSLLASNRNPAPPGGFLETTIFGNLSHRAIEIRLPAKIPVLDKAVRALFSKWPSNFNKCLVFGTIFVFRQFSFSLMKYYHLGLYYITIKSS